MLRLLVATLKALCGQGLSAPQTFSQTRMKASLITALKAPCGQALSARQRFSQTRMKPSLITSLKAPCGQSLSAPQRLSQTRMKPSMALSKCVLHFEGLRKPLGGKQTLLTRITVMTRISGLARFLGMASAVLLFLCTSIGYAMPDDREKLLELSADSADLNQQSHRGEYIGSVQLDQGTSHLRAASAITEGDKQNKLVRAIAKGNAKEQAHFWVLTAMDKPPLHAYADTIQYFPDKHLIVLSGNARVIQGDNSFSAPKINYDTLKQHVLSKNDGKERTVIIIHPEKKS